MHQNRWTGTVLCAAIGCCWGIAEAQWSNAALFSLPSEAGSDCKTGGIAPATGGGFHFVYLPNNNQLRYRRYRLDGSLSTPLTLATGTLFNAKIAEALNGEVHVVLEDWSDVPNARWLRSTDGGLSFATSQLLTTAGCAKHPLLAAFGTGSGADMIMSYYRNGTGCDKSLRFRRFNGVSWSAEGSLGSTSHSEYDCFGIARSPLDGSVYRSFASNGTTTAMRRYDGAWGPETAIYSGAWAVRQQMAINNSGQIMLVWDDTSRIKSMLHTPGVGSGPVVDLGPGGYSGSCHVCAIPGSNDFYMVVARDLVYGRRWTAGNWQAEELVQKNLAGAFTVTPLVSADAGGNLYCVWEYWASGKPQQWFAVRPGTPAGPIGTISGMVRDIHNQPLVGASVVVTNVGGAVTGANGAYSIQAPVGTHSVQAGKLHYQSQTASGVSVSQNSTTTVHFALPVEPPAAVSGFIVDDRSLANHLSWTAPSSLNFSGVMIRFSTAGYPASPTDGQLLVDQAGQPDSPMAFVHSNLSNGQTVYYSAFSYFQDLSRYYNLDAAQVSGTPAGAGDFDRDGDVDQSDFGFFQLCLSGSFVPQADPACQRAKFDADDDVDQDDLAIWQLCFSGPGIPSDPFCP